MKKAIVTGATGFIGSWVAYELVNQGVEVIALVRPNSEIPAKLKNRVKTVCCEMSDYHNLASLIEDRDFDAIYHFAWAGVSGKDLKNEELQNNNLKYTLDLIRSTQAINCKRFIGAGSLHEIEGYYEMQEDKIVTNLGFMYKASKIAAHWMGKALAGSLGIEFFWPIITNTYGVGEISQRLVNSIIRKILAGESPEVSMAKQMYDFVYISDVAKAFYLIGEKGIDGHNYTIGSGSPTQLRNYLEIVGELTNKVNNSDIEIGFGKHSGSVVYLPEKEFDKSNLTRDTGFEPQISFEEGIKKTIDWIIENM